MAKIERGTVKRRTGSPAPPTKTSTPSILDDLTVEAGVVNKLNGLLFGPPKTGKTTAACSGGKTLLISCDPEGAATETLRGRTDLTVVQPRTFQDVKDVVEALHAGAAADYDWVVLDSLTFLFLMAIGAELNAAFEGGTNTMREYGKGGAAVSQIISDMVALPCNVIFTAHLAKDGDDDGVAMDQTLGEHEVKVAVTPMVWKTLGPAVGFIGRTLRTKEYEKVGKINKPVLKYKVSFNDGDLSPAGSRYDMEGEYESTPTMLNDLYTQLRKEN